MGQHEDKKIKEGTPQGSTKKIKNKTLRPETTNKRARLKQHHNPQKNPKRTSNPH